MAQLARGGHRARSGAVVFLDEEDDLGVVRFAQADLVAVRQHAFPGPLAVDVGPELGVEVAQQEAAGAGGDFRVMARHTDARDLDVALGAAAKRENGLVDRNLAAAARIGDDETWCGRHPGHYSLTGANRSEGADYDVQTTDADITHRRVPLTAGMDFS